MRLNKFLSRAGIASRRRADELIQIATTTVNGSVCLDPAYNVQKGDIVRYDNRIVKLENQFITVLLNKPLGVITTVKDTHNRKTVMDLVNVSTRIFPIGRLDKDSEGLIFLTNDGDIVNKILRSENNNEKEYIVQVNRKITSEFLSNMSKGVKLKNIKTKPCVIQKINNYTFKIILTQGLNRQIRRMCNLFDYKVKSLIRTRIMNIELGSMKVGKFRKFFPNELQGLNKILEKSL